MQEKEEDALTESPDPKKDAKKKKTKHSKKDRGGDRFEGEGVSFRAKLIGVEEVSEPRGDAMCQGAMQRLKMNVRSGGPHKRKIVICISVRGIDIKDEKTGVLLYRHPVSFISYISQDITDARAFGYVFGTAGEPHSFIAIKTEKPAFHVVVALRDLFQAVLERKQHEMEVAKAKEEPQQQEEEEQPREENIYFEVMLAEPLTMRGEEEEPPSAKEEPKSVDELLGLQNELDQLQQGIDQMDSSIAETVVDEAELCPAENDPFDTSFVLGPKRDSLPMPIPVASSGDRYAAFGDLDASPSVFESPPDEEEEEEEPQPRTPPPKPPRAPPAPSDAVFADLDPLGKDRPYRDKADFFRDVKHPPKKVLNDLMPPSPPPSVLSSSLPSAPLLPCPPAEGRPARRPRPRADSAPSPAQVRCIARALLGAPDIFARAGADPFADDPFFAALPKRAAKTETA